MRALARGTLAFSILLGFASAVRADTLEDVFRQGNEAYFRGDYDAAAERFERLLELGVRDADVLYNLGTAHARAGRHGRAIAAFERALRLRPGDAEARTALDRSRAILAGRRAEREGEAEVETGPPLAEVLYGGVSADALAIALLVLEVLLFGVLAVFRHVRREPVRLALGIAAPLFAVGLVAAALGLAVRSGALDPGVPAVVVRDRVVLREGPRPDARERGLAREGERAWILGRHEDWVRLEVGARAGWAAAADVVPLNED